MATNFRIRIQAPPEYDGTTDWKYWYTRTMSYLSMETGLFQELFDDYIAHGYENTTREQFTNHYAGTIIESETCCHTDNG